MSASAKYKIIRRQKPVKGGREALPSCVIAAIRTAVDKEARSFRVSRSFVVAVRLARSYGITEQELFD